jgi:hypothetical protein
MGRSQDEKGADKAVSIRKAQSRDRSALAKDIEANQKQIAKLNDEAAPIRAEVRKVEAEVGPIKYIAKFIYGEKSADENMLEKAVTWIIILIVIVFDPLAVIMLLAAQMTFGWKKEEITPKYEADEGPLTDEQVEQIKESVAVTNLDSEPFDFSKHPYLFTPTGSHTPPGMEPVPPQVYKPGVEKKEDITPTTVDSSEVKVDEPTYQILPELEEESKKKSYMIKQGEQQIVKIKN